MCRKILEADIGVRGFHIYTMNLEKATKMLLEEMSLVPRLETVKPLPWRQVRLFFVYFIMYSHLSRFFTHSPLHPQDDKKPSDPYSGQTVPSHTCLVLRTGTSTPMVGLVTLAVLHTVL
jgi:hypothetical protein